MKNIGVIRRKDGNGRIHGYLIHHIPAKKVFAPKGFIFPVSSVILDRIGQYKEAMEAYSKPQLNFIEWEATPDGNVKVLNGLVKIAQAHIQSAVVPYPTESIFSLLDVRIILHQTAISKT